MRKEAWDDLMCIYLQLHYIRGTWADTSCESSASSVASTSLWHDICVVAIYASIDLDSGITIGKGSNIWRRCQGETHYTPFFISTCLIVAQVQVSSKARFSNVIHKSLVVERESGKPIPLSVCVRRCPWGFEESRWDRICVGPRPLRVQFCLFYFSIDVFTYIFI